MISQQEPTARTPGELQSEGGQIERNAHRYAREHGYSRPLYAVVRLVVTPFLRAWFRVRVSGAEHIPADGPAVIAPNHKSLVDTLFIGIATDRHLRSMAKIEMFKGPARWLLPRLGAFPVRRGEADVQALDTARAILAGGGVLVIFPEGTRVEHPDALGSPRHGAGRLALEAGVPIIPAAITGTSRPWRAALPRLRLVQLTFLAPTDLTELPPGRAAVSELIDHRVWPAVQDEYGRLRARPGLIAAALAAVGIGGGLLARRQLARRNPKLIGKLEPRKLRRRRTRSGKLGRARAWLTRAARR